MSAASKRIPSAELTAALSSTLGHDKSADLVAAAIRKQGFGSTLEEGEAEQVLEQVATDGGLATVAVRIARDRLGLAAPAPPSSGVRPRAEPLETDRTFSQAELTELLAATLGEEKARDVVAEGFRKAGHGHAPLDRSQALSLLDEMAKTPGLVGVTARFAKARLLLRTGG